MKNRRVKTPHKSTGGVQLDRPSKNIVPSAKHAAGVMSKSKLFEKSHTKKISGKRHTFWRVKDGARLSDIG